MFFLIFPLLFLIFVLIYFPHIYLLKGYFFRYEDARFTFVVILT